jgi:hypothetical protein
MEKDCKASLPSPSPHFPHTPHIELLGSSPNYVLLDFMETSLYRLNLKLGNPCRNEIGLTEHDLMLASGMGKPSEACLFRFFSIPPSAFLLK